MPMILFQTITTSIVVATLACDSQNWTPATSTHSSVPSTVVVSSYPSLNCIPSYHRCWNHYPQYLIAFNWQTWHIIIYHHRHLKYIVPLRQLPCQISSWLLFCICMPPIKIIYIFTSSWMASLSFQIPPSIIVTSWPSIIPCITSAFCRPIHVIWTLQ